MVMSTAICTRCGAALSDPRRVDDGMGTCCRRHQPHRRHIRFDGVKPDGTSVFRIYSLTIGGNSTRYEVSVNFEDGTFSCTCPDFQYRGRECKHIRRACDYETRRRERGI